MHRGKEQHVAHRVERAPKHTETIRRRSVERREPVLLGKAMVGGELKAASSHLLVVVEIGTAAAPATVLDVVGEDAAQPERIVPEMRLYQEAAARVGIIEIAT